MPTKHAAPIRRSVPFKTANMICRFIPDARPRALLCGRVTIGRGVCEVALLPKMGLIVRFLAGDKASEVTEEQSAFR